MICLLSFHFISFHFLNLIFFFSASFSLSLFKASVNAIFILPLVHSLLGLFVYLTFHSMKLNNNKAQPEHIIFRTMDENFTHDNFCFVQLFQFGLSFLLFFFLLLLFCFCFYLSVLPHSGSSHRCADFSKQEKKNTFYYCRNWIFKFSFTYEWKYSIL